MTIRTRQTYMDWARTGRPFMGTQMEDLVDKVFEIEGKIATATVVKTHAIQAAASTSIAATYLTKSQADKLYMGIGYVPKTYSGSKYIQVLDDGTIEWLGENQFAKAEAQNGRVNRLAKFNANGSLRYSSYLDTSSDESVRITTSATQTKFLPSGGNRDVLSLDDSTIKLSLDTNEATTIYATAKAINLSATSDINIGTSALGAPSSVNVFASSFYIKSPGSSGAEFISVSDATGNVAIRSHGNGAKVSIGDSAVPYASTEIIAQTNTIENSLYLPFVKSMVLATDANGKVYGSSYDLSGYLPLSAGYQKQITGDLYLGAGVTQWFLNSAGGHYNVNLSANSTFGTSGVLKVQGPDGAYIQTVGIIADVVADRSPNYFFKTDGSIDKNSYLIGNQTITLSGDVSGSGTTSISVTLATVPATKGGTGQTSYAVGDLLYASSTTALSRLADVATGNVLRSGGVGAAPAWGKVALATDVSGVLQAAQFPALTGDVTTPGSSLVTTLATVIAAGGYVGSSSQVPMIRWDAKGRLTGVDVVTITPAAIGAATAASLGNYLPLVGGTLSGTLNIALSASASNLVMTNSAASATATLTTTLTGMDASMSFNTKTSNWVLGPSDAGTKGIPVGAFSLWGPAAGGTAYWYQTTSLFQHLTNVGITGRLFVNSYPVFFGATLQAWGSGRNATTLGGTVSVEQVNTGSGDYFIVHNNCYFDGTNNRSISATGACSQIALTPTGGFSFDSFANNGANGIVSATTKFGIDSSGNGTFVGSVTSSNGTGSAQMAPYLSSTAAWFGYSGLNTGASTGAGFWAWSDGGVGVDAPSARTIALRVAGANKLTVSSSTVTIANNLSVNGAVDAGQARMQTSAYSSSGAWFGLAGQNSSTYASQNGLRCESNGPRLHCPSGGTIPLIVNGVSCFEVSEGWTYNRQPVNNTDAVVVASSTYGGYATLRGNWPSAGYWGIGAADTSGNSILRIGRSTSVSDGTWVSGSPITLQVDGVITTTSGNSIQSGGGFKTSASGVFLGYGLAVSTATINPGVDTGNPFFVDRGNARQLLTRGVSISASSNVNGYANPRIELADGSSVMTVDNYQQTFRIYASTSVGSATVMMTGSAAGVAFPVVTTINERKITVQAITVDTTLAAGTPQILYLNTANISLILNTDTATIGYEWKICVLSTGCQINTSNTPRTIYYNGASYSQTTIALTQYKSYRLIKVTSSAYFLM